MTNIRALTTTDLDVVCGRRARMFLEAGQAAQDV